MKTVKFEHEETPVKYAVMYTNLESEYPVVIVEVGSVFTCENEGPFHFWPDENCLFRIEQFHKNYLNHCPMFRQSWMACEIDFGEVCFATYDLFDTELEAVKFAEKCLAMKNQFEYKGKFAWVFPDGDLSDDNSFGVAAVTEEEAQASYEKYFGVEDEEPHFTKVSFLDLERAELWADFDEDTFDEELCRTVNALAAFKREVNENLNENGVFMMEMP